MLSTIVIVCLVLMVLCAVVGVIYAYLYFTRMNPTAKGHRGTAAGAAPGGGPGGTDRQPAAVWADDEQPGGPSTHMFLFRKS